MADNVLKFKRPEKKPAPIENSKPSLAVAVVVVLVTVAILVGGSILMGR